jgi:hypothetical protein
MSVKNKVHPRTPGAELPDHHDAAARCRLVAHASAALILAGEKIRMQGRLSIIHPCDHMPAVLIFIGSSVPTRRSCLWRWRIDPSAMH